MNDFFNKHTEPAEKEGEKRHTETPNHIKKELEKEVKTIEELETEIKPTPAHCPDSETINKELDDLKEQLKISEDKLLRAYAEVDNVRRRTEQEIQSAHRYGLEKFVEELIPAVDSLEKALETVGHDEMAHPMFGGVQLTLRMFLKVFEKFNITQINPLHQSFDPQLHDALSIKVDDTVEPNTVVSVLQKGYSLNKRVVRPAMVVVSKKS